MRPPEFTGGNNVRWKEDTNPISASMRPPEFTGGNVSEFLEIDDPVASLQ